MIKPPGCKTQRGLKILGLKIWHFVEDLAGCQTGGEKIEHIADADPHTANARPAAALLWIDRDSVGN